MLCCTWHLPNRAKLYVNTEIVAEIDDGVSRRHRFTVQLPENGAGSPSADFSIRGIAAQEARGKLLSERNPKVNRRIGSSKDWFKELAEQIHQLEDLVRLIRVGKSHNVRALSGSLRLLIAMGRPMPLLQLCAAANGAPLTAFTLLAEVDLSPFGPTSLANLDILPTASGPFRNPTDLDVYLDLQGGFANGKEYSHRQLIRAVGDTIGAHIDPDIDPVVDMMRSTQSVATGGQKWDMLAIYLVGLAEVVISLGHEQMQIFGAQQDSS